MNTDKKQKAQELYFSGAYPQYQIADILDIDEKTLYRWIKSGQWQQLRSSMRRMPSVMVEHIYAQLDDINYGISQRPIGQRFPTPQESLTINRLINSISKLKKQTSQGELMEMMTGFIEWSMKYDLKKAQDMVQIADAYINAKRLRGFHPYDIEYTTEDDTPSLASLREAHSHEASAATKQPSDEVTNAAETSEAAPQAPGIIGHESGILSTPIKTTQLPGNQAITPQNPAPKMPENPPLASLRGTNLAERSHELANNKQSHDNIDLTTQEHSTTQTDDQLPLTG